MNDLIEHESTSFRLQKPLHEPNYFDFHLFNLNLQYSHVWFDRYAMTKVASESRETLKIAYEYVKDIIKSENDCGIPTNRIIVGKPWN